MNIKPLGNNVVISIMDEGEVTASGIILPDNAKDKPERGTVIAVGAGKVLENGQRQAMEIKEGDKVLFKKYAAEEFKVGGDKMLVVDISGVIAIIE
ncbi:MAG TPA: co-chaperone GroES [Patescibacteria group bacterium]|nr:co-chaperone GroES [Patescibacteria group bacterium]